MRLWLKCLSFSGSILSRFPGLVRTKASQEKASAVLSRYEDRDKGKLSRYLDEGTGELVQNDNEKNSHHPDRLSFAVNRRPLLGADERMWC